MAYTIYNCLDLQGGGTRSLDSLSVGDLSNEDRAIVFNNGKAFFFEFDSTSTESETIAAHPFKIRPDDYASAGVWIEQETDYNNWDLDPIPAQSWSDISSAWVASNVPVVEGDVWTDEGNYVSWNEHSVWFGGVEYTIAAGNSSAQAGVEDHVIYWVAESSSYTVSATPPSLADTTFFIVATVSSTGVVTKVWTSFQNAVIGNAYIVNLSAAKILAGTVLTSGVYIGNGFYGDGSQLDYFKPADPGATEGATWGSDLDSIPSRIYYDSAAELSGKPAGLYLCDDYLGYWNGSAFNVYIRNNGQFVFAGDLDNLVGWNGANFVVFTESYFDIAKGGDLRFTDTTNEVYFEMGAAGTQFVIRATAVSATLDISDFYGIYLTADYNVELSGGNEVQIGATYDIEITSSAGSIYFYSDTRFTDDVYLSEGKSIFLLDGSTTRSAIHQSNHYSYWNNTTGDNQEYLQIGDASYGWAQVNVYTADPNVEGGSWGSTSSRDVKENLEKLVDPVLNKIKQLEPTKFDFKRGRKNAAGFIYEEVAPIFPLVVGKMKHDNGTETGTIIHDHFHYVWAKGFQELIDRVERLEGVLNG